MQAQQPQPNNQSLKQDEFLSNVQKKRSQPPSQGLAPYEDEQTQPQQADSQQKPQEYQPLQGYTISKTLGKGNFGKVKLALHKLTQQHVAVKILQKDLIFQNTDIVRITRQLKIMKKLRHPFVVQLYEIIETPKELYLIMEYAEGGDLFDKIVNEQKIKEKQAAAIFTQLALGMEYFHSKGVTHRDLKPENILLSKDGTIKIADFGLGNMFKPDEKLKTACGSPCYASPQMLNREAYDPKKIDIWSAGIILYALVCGYLPFEDQVTSKLYEKIKTTNVKLPSWVSSPCRNLIRGLLTKDPKLRFDVESILSHEMIAPHAQKYREMVKERQLTENKIEQICQQYDVQEREKLISDLNKNRHNNLTTLYYLAVKRIERLEMEEEEDDQEQFLRKENQKVKERERMKEKQKQKKTQKVEQKINEGVKMQEDVGNLTGIEYERKQQEVGIQKASEPQKIEEQTVKIHQPEENIKTEQQGHHLSLNDENSQQVSQQIVNSAQKSLNSGKQLSDDELEIHNLHHSMQIDFEATEEPVFEQKEEQMVDDQVKSQMDGEDFQEESEVMQEQEKPVDDQKVYQVKEEKSQRIEPVVQGNGNLIDEQKLNEAKIIEQSYQLSMQIQNTLAQLNQLAQLQQQQTREQQQKQVQKEQLQDQQKDFDPSIHHSKIDVETPPKQDEQCINQQHFQQKTVEESMIEPQEENPLKNDNQTAQQSQQVKIQIQQPMNVLIQPKQQVQDVNETIVEKPSQLKAIQQKHIQMPTQQEQADILKKNAQPQNQLQQDLYHENSHQFNEQTQHLAEIQCSAEIQLQQPVQQLKYQTKEHVLTSEAQINSNNFKFQPIDHPVYPPLFAQYTKISNQSKQSQLLESHVEEAQNPKTPPKPISPNKADTYIQKGISKESPQKKQDIKKINNLPKKKYPENKPDPNPQQKLKPKLSRQQPNRHLLFSNDKTLEKSSKQDKSSKEITSESTIKEQEKPNKNQSIKPVNRNIRFNERSQSKDSPIVFKSNKNINKLSEMLKKNTNNQSSSKEKLKQESPRPKQLKSKIPSKEGKIASSQEKDKTIKPGRQKITIAKEKVSIVREKFQIAKKVEPKIQKKSVNDKNKSIQQPQKSKKIITEFKQVPESIHQEQERSLEKNTGKVKPKVSPLLNNNSNKKTQKNFSDRFRKNIDEKKNDLRAPLKQYEETSISPVSGYYSRQEGQAGMKDKFEPNMHEDLNVSLEINQAYSSKEKYKTDSTKYNQPKIRTKVTISQYSSTGINPKSSTSITITSPKYYQPQSKYSNIYQHKTSQNRNSLNNNISSFGSYGNSTPSNRMNTVSYAESSVDFRDGSSTMSASNTKKFQRIEIDELNQNTLNIQFVHEEPTLLNTELIAFVSVQQLYQIVSGFANCSQNSMNIEGTLTVFEYPTKDYLYILKSDLFKSFSSKLSSSQYSKTLNMTQYSPTVSKIKLKTSNRTKIQTFEFVELINSIVMEGDRQIRVQNSLNE